MDNKTPTPISDVQPLQNQAYSLPKMSQGGPIRGPLETPQTSGQYATEGFKGGVGKISSWKYR